MYNSYLSLPYSRKNITLTRKGVSLLKKSLHKLIGTDEDIPQDLIPLAICLYTKLISPEMVITYLTKDSISTIRVSFTRLKKKGYLNCHTLGKFENTTKSLYYLTKKGYEYACSYITPDTFIPPYKNMSSIDSRLLHDYRSGFNALACLQIECNGLEIYRELGIKGQGTIPNGILKKQNAVYPDMIVKVKHSEGANIIYFEEDCMVENQTVLANKLLSYSEEALDSRFPNDCIVFSFCKINKGNAAYTTRTDYNPFSVPQLEYLYNLMKFNNIGSTKELENNKTFIIHDKTTYTNSVNLQKYNVVSENEETNIEKSSETRNICGFSKDTKLPGFANLSEYITQLLVNLHTVTGYYDEEGEVFNEHNYLTLEELQRYIEDIKNHTNPYALKDYLKSQYMAADTRTWNLAIKCKYIFSPDVVLNDNSEYVFRDFIYNGCQVFGFATELMTNYTSYISPSNNQPYSNVLWFLSYFHPLLRYYENDVPIKNVSEDLLYDYKVSSEVLNYINNCGGYVPKSLKLRNTITLPNKDTVSFEYVGHDIGAVYRVRAFYDVFMRQNNEIMYEIPDVSYDDYTIEALNNYKDTYKAGERVHHHVIAIVDSYEQSERYTKEFGIHIRQDKGLFNPNKHTLNFILEADLHRNKGKYEKYLKNMYYSKVLYNHPYPGQTSITLPMLK